MSYYFCSRMKDSVLGETNQKQTLELYIFSFTNMGIKLLTDEKTAPPFITEQICEFLESYQK